MKEFTEDVTVSVIAPFCIHDDAGTLGFTNLIHLSFLHLPWFMVSVLPSPFS